MKGTKKLMARRIASEPDALLAAILEKAFNGEL